MNKIHSTCDKDDGRACYFAQLFFWERVKETSDEQAIMARIALSIGDVDDAPAVSLAEIRSLSWHNYHAALELLHLSSSAHISWHPIYIHKLKQWAVEK
jgi:hypothetical protein